LDLISGKEGESDLGGKKQAHQSEQLGSFFGRESSYGAGKRNEGG